MKALLDLYRQQFRTTFASMFQYRAALVIWMIWQVTEPLPAAANRLKRLGISPPPPVVKIDASPTHTPHLH